VRVASLVYSIRHDGTALIIGPGGGTDVVSALYYGAPKVVGVEVNPIIAESIMGKTFADYSGNLYRDPRVHVVTDEGRSFVRRSTEPYASIQATLVDTWAAAASGAFTLTENNLYTVEAFTEFLDHLRADGVLTVTRWYDPGQPREFLRLIALAREALERSGVAAADVRKHVVLATDNERRATLLLGKSPFSESDLAKLTETAAEGRLTLLYMPSHGPSARSGDRFLASFLEAPSAREFLDGLSYDDSPTTDDRPFFFYTVRPGDLGSVFANVGSLERNNLGIAVLLGLLGLSAVLTIVLVVLPLLLFRRDVLRESPGPKLRVLAYFLALGFGFILVELGFMQRFVLFLGHPIYALAVVLAVLLGASGTGSALSGWGSARYGLRGFVRRAVGALAVVLILYAVALGPVFRLLIGLPLFLRIVVTALLVFVPGLLMGSLLPTGVRNANALGPGMVPWAWGLNGASSVVGSILAVALSMNFGFTLALLAGVVVYALGMLALPGLPGSSSTESRNLEPKPKEAIGELVSSGVQP
jgi:spermidine synthase